MKRQTTENWFKRVLTDGGPLATAFAVDAIYKLAKKVAEAPDEELDTAFVLGAAWKKSAVYWKGKIDERMGVGS